MCGIAGLLIKDPSLEPELGTMLASMICALADRGPDSAGFGVYARAAKADRDHATRLSLAGDDVADWDAVGASLRAEFGADVQVALFDHAAIVEVHDGLGPHVEKLLSEMRPSPRVVGRGASVAVIKAIGRPEQICRRSRLPEWSGYLGIAHTRMATESAVTLDHSHPFVPVPDLCVVHNGSFSNYASVRRDLQARGVVFESDNDSEVGARVLAERLGAGDNLAEATRWVMKELDGFFTLVITTAGGMSVVRDAFACKPAVVAETKSYVAVASEYRALAALPAIRRAQVFEPQPEEVYTWTC
jgi:methylamine---glutamate N-methyltransferase subunit A